MPPLDFDKLKEDLISQWGDSVTDQETLSAALYPDVYRDYKEFRSEYGPVDKLDTRTFLVGPDIADEIEVCFLSSDVCVIMYNHIYCLSCSDSDRERQDFAHQDACTGPRYQSGKQRSVLRSSRTTQICGCQG